MIGIIIGVIAAIVIIVLAKKDAKKCAEEFNGNAVAVAVVAGLVLALLVDFIAFESYKRVAIETTTATELVASEKIVALQDNTSVSGSFFLGSGSVDNKNYYAFYYEAENGFKYMTLDAESPRNPVYIKYISSDNETPRIDRFAIVERKHLNSDTNPIWFSLIAFGKYGKYAAGEIISEKITGPTLFTPADEANYYDNFRYEIHIPEGSIKTEYAIDLE